ACSPVGAADRRPTSTGSPRPSSPSPGSSPRTMRSPRSRSTRSVSPNPGHWPSTHSSSPTPPRSEMEQANITGGAHLARALKAEGITRVFGIPGTHNLEIFARLSAEGIDIVSPRHEQGAGYMADGAARLTGEVNVVVTTTGPAVLNALTALLQSFTDSVPVLLICPGMPLSHPGRGNGLLHEVRNQSGALAAVLTEVHRATAPPVGQTRSAMRPGRTRPAAIEIPLDLIEATGPGRSHPSVTRPLPTPDADRIDAAAEALAACRRPLIIAGAGAHGAGQEIEALAA